MSKHSEFIIWAKNEGWNVIDRHEDELQLSNVIVGRYKTLSNEHLGFLRSVKQCITPSEKTWFICENEYNDNSDIAFKWNEFEVLSLEVAKNDDEWKLEISTWWDSHLPIVMSVDNGYSFYAIDLKNDGSIVQGYEPEFEEVEKVANNLEEFLELIMANKIEMK
ncbi:SMI1/KNR4 family protein [Clostridium estertheticum]|uniref:SMI1/KNR4 family protein n=1 Tax=Clostridium estertheticum TaxID=238834 RepID=UPI001C0CE7D9|nr:SMI1/KNR4 family protein [Clostridium estertheticum]MBU3179415.1 SMI1/KNR4 family protein [Clostridium estertheticum]